jgi:lipopolysaccharide/colanic/teichoic acid biosynthesis glycosyltransferase
MTSVRRSAYQRWGKRTLDVIGAACALILLAPVCLVVAALVRWRLGSPVLFRDVRAGRDGVPFLLLKFRTMTDERDAAGNLRPDGERLTTLGRSLRSWSLDELPELLHVLTGEMSLVGPRPLPLKYTPRYTPAQARRLEVAPGLTGLAQTSGRNSLSWEDRFALDAQYVERCSLVTDLDVLVRTGWVVVTRAGISHPGHDTMHEFLGTVR